MFKRSDNPTWRFAPNLGGAEYGNNAAQAHFANDALSKMVREILQNSLDHPAPGLETVEVAFRTIDIDPENIGANQLKEHVNAALKEVTENQDSQAMTHYQQMINALGKTTVTCLAITDAGTTGLRDENWRNLIFREGTPTHTPGESKGGSFGFGKNAPFNLSDCNTLVYSTKYLTRGKNGVVQHMSGRAQLVTHDNPERPGERLQQIGFLALHEKNKPNQPIEGPQIPEAFRLKETGTGVFVIGFNPDRDNWTRVIAETTVTQFFYAIHTGKLTVSIKGNEDTPQEINQANLQAEIERLPQKSPTRYYHAAVTQDAPMTTEPSGLLDIKPTSKRMQLWINTDRDAPRRLAHINRRGMLITQDRRFSQNPFCPEGGAAWSGWAGVSMAENDETDQFLRKMEPPAHDAVQLGQLRDWNEQDSAKQELRHQRRQITKIIHDRVNDQLASESENVTELADLFPDQGPGQINKHHIKPRIIEHNEESDLKQEREDDEPTDHPEPNPDETKTREVQTQNRENVEKTPSNPTPEISVQNARIIRTAPDELTMSILMPNTKDGTLTFQIKTAGEQYQRNEEHVSIREIAPSHDMLVRARLVDDSISLSAPANTQVTLRLKLQDEDQPYRSYSLIKTSELEASRI